MNLNTMMNLLDDKEIRGWHVRGRDIVTGFIVTVDLSALTWVDHQGDSGELSADVLTLPPPTEETQG